MIHISIYLASILIDVVTTAVVPSLNKKLREVLEVALLVILNHSRGGGGEGVGRASCQDHRGTEIDRAGSTTINRKNILKIF